MTPPSAHLSPIDLTLTGTHVTLKPLSHDHHDPLAHASAAGQLHKLWYTSVPSADGMAAEITRRLAERDAGRMIPFTQVDASGTPVGMTTYMNIDHATPRVEIGSTWIGPNAQRGPLNTEAKRLLLAHAFEVWGCLAVEFRTHRLNQQSRSAIERLGAQFDGILRAHMRSPNGTTRDTAVYSITAPEWPVVRSHLDWQILRPR
ncbi:GNAT family N-acetyltransferase [Rhodobacteraceae bacterium N5(2021)]|uniref:GNAT family N-acetyltransferase n=1 Tax=Gymnodinialimonas phycosphaerae TaxID=2841589 RepID=A0A975TYC0_9RHOB|nr:GNAT family protein [Gymnodinialimonas phycosphaerae]MBY4892980.1 GNAT family N-acetyltransferase [Gymnodinialimonas phycosphaerae]